MARFDEGIQYTTASPSAKTGNVLYDVNVDEGKEAIARGVEGVGQALFEVGQKVQKEKDMADYYEGMRKIDEAGYAAHNLVDGENDKVLWDKFQQESNQIVGSYKSGNVQRMLKQRLNTVSPDWMQSMYTKSLAIKEANAESKVKFESEKLLENGDVTGTTTLYTNVQSLNPSKKEYYNQLIYNAPVTSLILQANKAIQQNTKDSLDNANGLITMLQSRTDLTAEQMEKVNNLGVLAIKARKRTFDEFGDGLMIEQHKADADKVSGVDRYNIARQQENRVLAGRYTYAETKELMTDIKTWEKGPTKVNTEVANGLWDKVWDAEETGEVASVERDINAAAKAHEIDRTLYERLNNHLHRERNTIETKLLKEKVADFTENIITASGNIKIKADKYTNIQDNIAHYRESLQQAFKKHPDWDILKMTQEADRYATLFMSAKKGGQVQLQSDRLTMEMNKEKPQSGQIPIVKNDIDYDALPSGTVFIDPKGKQRTKP